MPSKREEVLQALHARLQAVPLVKVERNRLRPERLPPEGLIILRDGDVGEPEILLSPLSYVWTHAARIEVFSGAADPDGHLDDLLMAIATALTADPTLGGLVDLIDVGAPDFDAAAPEGGADVKAAIVSVRLIYE
ncbi:MAG: acyl-CoA transferase, partial [Rhodospirillales bacterium]